jgi:RHS repeat-associated protein
MQMQLGLEAQIPDGLLAANAQLGENSHQGVPTSTHALYQGFGFVISNTALGMRGSLYDEGVESRYTGKERDTESGLDYFGARYYSSNMGRWMSPDWAASVSPVPWANLADPQTLNLYEYVRNNPLSLVDDDGHNWFTQFAQGLADSTYRPLVQIAEHPIATAQGIGTAIEHPIVTGKAIGSAVAGTVEAAAHGDGRAIGQIVGTVGTAIAGGAALRGVGVAGEVGAEAGSFVGESTSVTTTELYRAVDATELQSIQSTGSFLPSPNGTEYKGFFFSQESAEQFGAQQAAGGGPSTTVVRGTAPTDLVNGSPVHSAATEGRGVLIHNDNLPQVKPQ